MTPKSTLNFIQAYGPLIDQMPRLHAEKMMMEFCEPTPEELALMVQEVNFLIKEQFNGSALNQ